MFLLCQFSAEHCSPKKTGSSEGAEFFLLDRKCDHIIFGSDGQMII